jgi:transcriptional regulator with PAS, ATPase and Fis domain
VAGIAAGVFESQLFGYVPGAYSGSGRGSPGILAAHAGGAVFLDEIGELALDLQAKLLRAIENGEIVPVGATKPVRVDVRIVTATNRPLEAMVAAGRFRGDLLARFLSAQLEIPPLRERVEDVPTIAAELLRRRGVALPPEAIEVEAVERLMLHPYPFNVRELAAALDRAIDVRTPALRLHDLERVLGPAQAAPHALTRELVERTLTNAGGNETEAARQLGISRGKLRRFRGS